MEDKVDTTITVDKDTDGKYKIVRNDNKVLGRRKSKIEAIQNAIKIANEHPVETKVIIRRG